MGVGQEARVGEGIKCKGPEVQPLILLPALSQVYSVGAGFLNERETNEFLDLIQSSTPPSLSKSLHPLPTPHPKDTLFGSQINSPITLSALPPAPTPSSGLASASPLTCPFLSGATEPSLMEPALFLPSRPAYPAPLCLLMCRGGRSPGLGFPYGGNQNDDTERPLP